MRDARCQDRCVPDRSKLFQEAGKYD
jgi:hypothetical protein